MKRILTLFLALILIPVLPSCGDEQAESVETAEGTTEVVTEPAEDVAEETKSEEEAKTRAPSNRVYESCADPLTRARVEAIPVANSSMTTDELRQICVDYVCLSVSFQWIPNSDYQYKVVRQEAVARFYEGQLYGGIPYVNVASGNLYRILEIYDSETGIMDLTPFRQKNLLWGTACSGTTGWGWARVINSAKCAWTADLNTYNGLLRVGAYTYDDSTKRYGENGKEDCNDIAKRNGAEMMYSCYAQMKMADCLVNNGHVRMVKSVHTELDTNGNIDPKKSYVMQCEQGLYTTSAIHDRISSDGTKYKIQGNDDLKSSFYELYKGGYLPHTFKEFLGLDPVEPSYATIGLETDTVSLRDLQRCTLTSNYVISDVFTTLYDKDGKELFSYIKRMDNHFEREITLLEAIPGSAVQKHQTSGDATIKITCQLGTGEHKTVYEGTLKG